MSDNPYTSVSIAGYDSSPPPDDGTQVAANLVRWSAHKDKHSDPLKTLAEGINSNVVAAFDLMVMTDDPAQGTVVGAMEEFVRPMPMLAQRARLADRAISAETAETADELSDSTENIVIMMQEFG